jgi:hypothetical protein
VIFGSSSWQTFLIRVKPETEHAVASVRIVIMLLTAILAMPADSQNTASESDSVGTIKDSHFYQNASLGLSISLPGNTWHFKGTATRLGPQVGPPAVDPKCSGPLCGQLAIDVAMSSGEKPREIYTVFLGAHKLATEFMDRKRYPLRKFAQVIVVQGLKGQWEPEGKLTFQRLDSRAAYKLITHNHRVPSAKGLMYVSESNGYVFLLVGTALKDSEKLQSAIEAMNLGRNNN